MCDVDDNLVASVVGRWDEQGDIRRNKTRGMFTIQEYKTRGMFTHI